MPVLSAVSTYCKCFRSQVHIRDFDRECYLSAYRSALHIYRCSDVKHAPPIVRGIYNLMNQNEKILVTWLVILGCRHMMYSELTD